MSKPTGVITAKKNSPITSGLTTRCKIGRSEPELVERPEHRRRTSDDQKAIAAATNMANGRCRTKIQARQ